MTIPEPCEKAPTALVFVKYRLAPSAKLEVVPIAGLKYARFAQVFELSPILNLLVSSSKPNSPELNIGFVESQAFALPRLS